MKPPTVYFVGAGPGDPGLITVRGAELLAAFNALKDPAAFVKQFETMYGVHHSRSMSCVARNPRSSIP